MQRLAVSVALMGAWALVAPAAMAQPKPPEAAASAAKPAAKKAAKRAANSSMATAKRATPPAAAPDWNARLVTCKNEAGMNLIKREKCVYANCKGHWGEGECPPGQDLPTQDSFRNPFKRSES